MPNIEVICPCCDNILLIDTSTKEVISHREHKKQVSLQDFLESEKNKPQELEKKLMEAKEKEKNREEYLKQKFEEAKNNKDLKDAPPSIIWD